MNSILDRLGGFDDDAIAQIGGRREKIGNPTGKAGDIVSVMEQRLMLGYYRPGEMLSFNILADEFKVSRQPVSAAISHLRASGYVEVMPHVGCKVVQPSYSEIRDFFFMLGKIEGGIVFLAAKRHGTAEANILTGMKPPRDLAKLERMQQQRKAYIHYVDQYHDQIWKMAGAPLLEGKISGLRKLAHFYLWQGIPTLGPAAARKLSAERAEVAKAVAARDAELAARLMEQHIAQKPELIGVGS